MTTWLDKFKEARILVELSYDYLREQNVESAVAQIETAVNLYKEILDDPVLDLIQNVKTMIQGKLQNEQDKLKVLRKALQRRTRLEMKKVPPKYLKYSMNRKPK